jgi:bifunctional DNA primase/polymerase-like protein
MLQTFDQTADPAVTLFLVCRLFAVRYGIDVGDDWGVWGNGVCRCPKARTCAHPGKHPARSKPRENATRDPDEIRERIALGRNMSAFPDHRHVVVDVESNGLGSLLEWCRLTGLDPAELLDTLTVCSGGGGFHLWYWLPVPWRACPPRGMDHWLPWVDTKSSVKASDKATLPGSRHHSGGLYTLKTDDAGNFPDPARAPEPLLRAMAAGRRWVTPEDEWKPLDASGAVSFADVHRWLDPRTHARILSPHEAGPPPPASGVRYSGSEVDTSGWGLPTGDDTWDGTPS